MLSRGWLLAATHLRFIPMARHERSDATLVSNLHAVSFAGDVTRGAASTGPVLSHSSDSAAGFICVIEADSSGRAEFLNMALNPNLQVWAGTGCAALFFLPC